MIIPLSCAVQKYSWGEVGTQSKVASLAFSDSNKHSDVKFDPNASYAEFWLGTHPNGPSYVIEQNKKVLLSDKIKHSLPFLLKCLSVRTALSIQAHPDKELAKRLRALNPSAYPDDQAKPEMALAINGQFHALVGFRPIEEIIWFISRIPPFANLVLGDDLANKISNSEFSSTKEAFKSMVNRIMNLDAESLKLSLSKLKFFFETGRDLLPPKEVFFKLSREFPDDVGILFAFLLNHVILEEGECIFLGANEPHAYLSGSCIELMTSSDNVVRAGLTPKFKDVSTLINMLTYESSSSNRFLVPKDNTLSRSITLYKPPIDEFALQEIVVIEEVAINCKDNKILGNSESLLLITEGTDGVLVTDTNLEFSLSNGSSFYIGPDLNFVIQNLGTTPIRAYRAFIPKI